MMKRRTAFLKERLENTGLPTAGAAALTSVGLALATKGPHAVNVPAANAAGVGPEAANAVYRGRDGQYPDPTKALGNNLDKSL